MSAAPTLEHAGRLRVLTALFAIAAVGAVADRWGAPDRAAGRTAVRIVPRTEGQLAAALAAADDVWSEGSSAGDPLVVAVAPARLEQLRAAGLGYQVIVDDIDASADRERQRLAHRDTAARGSTRASGCR